MARRLQAAHRVILNPRGFAVSSVASHVHATSSFASSLQPQTAGSTPDSDSDPFAAVLDAVAAGADQTAAPDAPQPATKQTSNASDGSAGGNATTTSGTAGTNSTDTPATSGKSGTAQSSNASATADDTAKADGPGIGATADGNLTQIVKAGGAGQNKAVSSSGGKGTTSAASISDRLNKLLAAATDKAAPANSAAQTQASASSTADANTPAGGNTANTPASGATDVAGIIAAVKAALAGPKPQAAASDLTDKSSGSASSKDSSDDSSDSTQSDSTDATTTASAQAQQPVTQPVAAAITVDNQLSTPQASGNTAADVKIGDTVKSRLKLAMASTTDSADSKDNANAPASNGTEGVKQASGNPELKAGKQASANNPSTTAAPDSSTAQQDPPTTDNATAAQVSGNVTSVTGNSSAPRTETFAAAVIADATGSAGTQTASTSTKIDGTGLPNFGISAANGSAAATGTAAPATTNAANAVPIAGLAVAISSRAQAGSSQFNIRLDPAELGRIEVRLDVASDGRVTSHVTVDRADTLQLLQDQQPQLQQALDQAGLKTADNGLQFTLRDQSFAGQNNNGGNGAQQNASQLVIPDADLPTVQSAQIYNRLSSGTGVDISV
jgi:flagellar hook-length control protein FliK